MVNYYSATSNLLTNNTTAMNPIQSIKEQQALNDKYTAIQNELDKLFAEAHVIIERTKESCIKIQKITRELDRIKLNH